MILGTRGSSLAMAQARMVMEALARACPELKVELRKVRTTGDEVRDRPLRSLGGIGAFTKELDKFILKGEIDAAVNSLKDMPVALTPGTVIAAVLPRGPVEDVLVSEEPLEKLPPGAVVGTSSVRRAAVLRRLRPDLTVKDLRGNVTTRLRKLREGEYDAIVLAKAGLERLDLKVRCHALDPKVFVPSAGQGAIAVVCAEGCGFLDQLRRIDHFPTRIEVEAERRVLGLLGGGCYLPIGVLARLTERGMSIRAQMMDEEGGRLVSSEADLEPGDEQGLESFAQELLRRFQESARDTCAQTGEVFLVGAGPGDPGLLTLKGLEALRRAEVVVHDALIGEALLNEAPKEAEVIDVGKRGCGHKAEQAEINELLVKKAREGKKVVRLKGGDPFLFGRGGEEAEALRRAGLRVHLIPGVTSAIAAPAMAGIPVTHRKMASHVTFVTGHESAEKEEESIDWGALAQVGKAGGTLVILMGMSNLRKNMQRLIEAGMDRRTPVAVVEKGSLPGQRTAVATLGNVAEVCESLGMGAPAVIVVGEVARMREVLGDLA
ncbi:MAG: uroporphyrinogen-III C-methyltransferase [Methanomassiliicoccales archaeon]